MAKGGVLATIGVGAAVSAVAGAYKVAEFVLRLKKLHEVGPENEVFVRLIERVRRDLKETERLLKLPEVKYALSTNAAKLAWIESTIRTTKETLYEIAQYTKRVQADVARGKHVGMVNRVVWVIDEHEKLVHRELELATAHQSLSQVLNFLSSLESLACCTEAATAPPPRTNPPRLGYGDVEERRWAETRQVYDDWKEEKDTRQVYDEYDTKIYRKTEQYETPVQTGMRLRAQWGKSRL